MSDTSPLRQDTPLRDLETRWGISRKTVKSWAEALGVELLRPSSTESLWPAEYVPLGDQLHEFIRSGGALREFPAVQLAAGNASSPSTAITAAAPVALAIPPGTAITTAGTPGTAGSTSNPLLRARRLKAAAAERLALLPEEAVELSGGRLNPDAEQFTLGSYRFLRAGGSGGLFYVIEVPISRKELLEAWAAADQQAAAAMGVPAVPAVTAPAARDFGLLASVRGTSLFELNRLS